MLIVVTGLLLGIFGKVAAQNVGAGLIVAGVASQIDGDSWGGYNKLGYSLGGFAWYDFNDRVSLSPEITIGHRGSREMVDGYEQYNLNVIDVPLLVRYCILGDINAQNLQLEAGPSANILISAKSGFGQQKLDLMPQFNRLNLSINTGATFFVNKNIGIMGRWSYALTNMNKNANVFRVYYRCHFLTFGVRLAFK
jgi:hypothetical protein